MQYGTKYGTGRNAVFLITAFCVNVTFCITLIMPPTYSFLAATLGQAANSSCTEARTQVSARKVEYCTAFEAFGAPGTQAQPATEEASPK